MIPLAMRCTIVAWTGVAILVLNALLVYLAYTQLGVARALTCQNEAPADTTPPKLDVFADVRDGFVVAGSTVLAQCIANEGSKGMLGFDVNILGSPETANKFSRKFGFTYKYEKMPVFVGINKCKKYSKATIQLPAVSRHGEKKAFIECFVKSDGKDVAARARHTFVVKDGPRKPRMGRANFAVAEGEMVKVRCSAFVAGGGHLTWVLDIGETYLEWRVYLDRTVQVVYAETRVYAGLKVPKVKKDSGQTPAKIESVLAVMASGLVKGATLTCFSLIPRLVMDKSSFSQTTKLFKSISFKAQSPTLVIHYAGLPSIVYDQTLLKVTCSAYVGTNGSLLWELVNLNIPFDLSQRCPVSSAISENPVICEIPTYRVKQEEETGFYAHGPYVKSSMELNVSRDLEYHVIRCSVVKTVDAFPDEERISDSSLPLMVRADPAKARMAQRKKVSTIELVFGLLTLVFFMGALVSAIVVLTRKLKENDEASKPASQNTMDALNQQEDATSSTPNFLDDVLKNLFGSDSKLEDIPESDEDDLA